MPIRISEALGVSHEAFTITGAFDGCIDVDSRLYVDPHLLAAAATPELADSHARFQQHFIEVIALLKASSRAGDALWRSAERKLTFREIRGVGLGFSVGRPTGSGIGPRLAGHMLATADDIVRAGVEDPTIFELVGLLEEGIGPDRVSDMAISIIRQDLLAFSERVARELEVPVKGVGIRGREYQVPTVPRRVPYLILVPSEVLRNLPVAESWEDIDWVRWENEELRERVNRIIGNTWRSAARRPSKAELRRVLIENPSLLRDLLRQYNRKPARPYDQRRDPAGEVVWVEASRRFSRDYPLPLAFLRARTTKEVEDIVRTIVRKFVDLVEKNGLNQLLYDTDGKPKPERAAQLLFFGIADAYCQANNLDLSREPNAGRGAVDFKVSAGYTSRVTVEIKLSTNKKLVHGWATQLPIYQAAEKAVTGICLVLQVAESETLLKQLMKERNKSKDEGQTTPDVIVADARLRPSASHA